MGFIGFIESIRIDPQSFGFVQS